MLEIEDRAVSAHSHIHCYDFNHFFHHKLQLNDTSGKCIRCLNSFVFTMLSEENGYFLHRISSLFEV